jgi:hypothetical protein
VPRSLFCETGLTLDGLNRMREELLALRNELTSAQN